MTWTDKRSRKARLAAAKRRWALEDRRRGITPYGIRKPHRRPEKRPDKQFNQALVTLGIYIMMWLVVLVP